MGRKTFDRRTVAGAAGALSVALFGGVRASARDATPTPAWESVGHPVMLALDAAIDDLKESEGIAIEEMELVSMRAHEWPDSCMGEAAPGNACLTVITPGFVIEFDGGFRYHCNRTGGVRRVRDDVQS